MYERIVNIIFLVNCVAVLYGQTPVGSWSDRLIYNSAVDVCASSSEIYVSTGSSVMIFNKEYDELKKMSKINGLTETGISCIGWSEEYKTLIIGYASTNIDLVKKNSVINMPDIVRKYIPGDERINKIRIYGKYAYLACSFGIALIDIGKEEIYDVWKPGTASESVEILDIAFGDGKIFAATESGLYYSDQTSAGLAYFGNWSLINDLPEPYGTYNAVVWAGGKLYANLSKKDGSGDRVYVYDNSSSLFSYTPNLSNLSFEPSGDGFLITSPKLIRHFSANGSLIKSIDASQWKNPHFMKAALNGTALWIADKTSGLLRYDNSGTISSYTLPGPLTNDAFHITSTGGKTIISAGGTDGSWNKLQKPLQLSIHSENIWTGISDTLIWDGMRSLIDPDDKNHFFVSTWGSGLLEFRNNQLHKQYNEENSPLKSNIPGEVRICGLAMDNSKNLWIVQSATLENIKVLKPDGSWIVNPVTIDAQTIGDLIITQNGYKWIILSNGNGLMVYDDNKTPENFTDDRWKKMAVEESNGEIIYNISSIVEDIDGDIWIGSSQGPLVYYTPEEIFNNRQVAYRPRISRNDGSDIYDYALHTEDITSIAVDGANRKWMGTAKTGVYLLSPDGSSQIRNYTEDNSPLLSNSIVSMAVDNNSGDVWFGTSKGVQSVRGDAIAGKERYDKAYAFPNPVRPEFAGDLTITGLMNNTRVKITDVSGNLVYETDSNGGEATWDLRTYNGRRVTSGVYIAFCSNSDGSASCAIKILVMR